MASFSLNGEPLVLEPTEHRPLIDFLREQRGLTGAKMVCGAGVCGACTVLVDGQPTVSCLLPCSAIEGRSVVTIEHIGAAGLHPIQKAFMAHDALQCGFCTPGFVVEAVAFHDAWRAANATARPSHAVIAAALSGHLCRCGAYAGIYRAVEGACAGTFDAGTPQPARIEARAKVTGAAKYTVDTMHPGQLKGVILRAPLAHGRVVRIDCTPAHQVPGIVAAIALVAVGDVVRYHGQAVAAVAAGDLATARKGLAAIRVEYAPLPAVIGYDAARAVDAPLVYRGFRKPAPNAAEGPILPSPWKRNLRGPSAAFSLNPKLARRLISDAQANADPLLVEGTWRTEAQCHTCFEPHAAVAEFKGDRLTVHMST